PLPPRPVEGGQAVPEPAGSAAAARAARLLGGAGAVAPRSLDGGARRAAPRRAPLEAAPGVIARSPRRDGARARGGVVLRLSEPRFRLVLVPPGAGGLGARTAPRARPRRAGVGGRPARAGRLERRRVPRRR